MFETASSTAPNYGWSAEWRLGSPSPQHTLQRLETPGPKLAITMQAVKWSGDKPRIDTTDDGAER